MIGFTVETDFVPVKAAFANLKRKLENAKEPLKQAMYEWMESTVKKRFESGGIPRWRERSRAYDHPILIDTQKLMSSVTNRFSSNKKIQHPDGKSVTLVSKVEYAIYHNEGTNKMPKRPFLFLTQEDADFFKDALRDWAYEKAIECGFYPEKFSLKNVIK